MVLCATWHGTPGSESSYKLWTSLCLFQDSEEHWHAAGWPKLLPHKTSHRYCEVQVCTNPASTPLLVKIIKYRLLHRKCAVQIFIHEMQNLGKQTSERSKRGRFPKFCNE